MPGVERLVRELNRHMDGQDFDGDPELIEDLLDEQSEALNADGVGRNAMENEIDNLLAGGDFGDVLNGLQGNQGSQRHLLVQNGAMTEEELLSDFEEVIWFQSPMHQSYCSASRYADNLFLTSAHCVFDPSAPSNISDIRYNNDSLVDMACVNKDHKLYHDPKSDKMLPMSKFDMAMITLNNPEFQQGKTMQLSQYCPQMEDYYQRVIGWGGTGKYGTLGCSRPMYPPKQRSGAVYSYGVINDLIFTAPNEAKDPNKLSKAMSGVCPGDSGGFIGYLLKNGQLLQTGISRGDNSEEVKEGGFLADVHTPICGDTDGGKWVRDVMNSDWASNPNCKFLKFRDPDITSQEPDITSQAPDKGHGELSGRYSPSYNRAVGMSGDKMGLIIVFIALLFAYLINKLRAHFSKMRTE